MATVDWSPTLLDDLASVPFLEGGNDPEVGLDAVGLLVEVYRRAGRDVTGLEEAARAADVLGWQNDDGTHLVGRFLELGPAVPMTPEQVLILEVANVIFPSVLLEGGIAISVSPFWPTRLAYLAELEIWVQRRFAPL